MRRINLVLGLVFIIAGMLSALAQSELRGGGTVFAVSGNVKADELNLADALVFLMIDGNITESVATDADGNFSLGAIEGNSYVIGVFKNGYMFDPSYQFLGLVEKNQTVNFQNGVRLCVPAPFGQSGNFCQDGVPTPVSGAGNGRIAYEVFGNAFAVNADGTNQAQLPPAGSFPSWSFDGTRVLSNRDPSTDTGFDQELFVMNANGSSFQQITANFWNDYRARFSPDGSRIVFDRLVNTGDRGIYTMNSDGTNEIRLTPIEVLVQDASYSPDGTKIVYTDGIQIFAMNADGSSPTQLTFTGAGIFNMEPSWSPDGLHIVFISDRGGDGNEIWRMTATGSESIALTGDEFDKRTPVYSPDGTKIAFPRSRSVNDFMEIFTKPIFGGVAQRMTFTLSSNNAENPQWQRVITPSTVTTGTVAISFANATTPGTTVATPIAASAAGFLPSGFVPFGANAFDVRTSAAFSGAVEVCFSFPAVTDQALFDTIVVFHNENGQLIDRTSRRDFALKIVCASVESLSPFIAAIPVAPTAANGSVAGRVSTSGGAVGNAVVSLIRSDGSVRTTRTGQFGYFRFDEIALGETVVVEVRAKSRTFAPRVVFLIDELTFLEFVTIEMRPSDISFDHPPD